MTTTVLLTKVVGMDPFKKYDLFSIGRRRKRKRSRRKGIEGKRRMEGRKRESMFQFRPFFCFK